MKPFTATFTPLKTHKGNWGRIDYTPDKEKERPVVVIAILPAIEGEGKLAMMPLAIFIDNDGTLCYYRTDCFTNCLLKE